jgi:chromosomal replication initiation ATPase DnaA
MYFPHDRLRLTAIRPLYANKRIPSIYSRHIQRLVDCSIGSAFNVSCSEMRSGRRGRGKIAFARQVAMYLSHVAGGLSLGEVGTLYERDRTTVAHACAVVEDARDNALLDRSLSFLEFGLSAAFATAGGAR